MKRFVNATPLTLPVFGKACRVVGALSLWFCAAVAWAETPLFSFRSAEGYEGYTSFDVLDTNVTYPVTRAIFLETRLENSVTNPPVQISDLVISCAIPLGLGVSVADFEEPFYQQWNASATSFVFRAAVPMTNETYWWPNIDLICSNAWAKPKIQVQRAAFPTRVPAGQSVTQAFIITANVAPGALSGYGWLSLQLDVNDTESSGVAVQWLTNMWPSSSFYASDAMGLPYYFSQNAQALSGLYTFTNILWLTNASASDVNFMPGLQVVYSQEQTPWTPRGQGTVWAHSFTNGIVVRASTPEPVEWQEQQERNRNYWELAPKWCLVSNDLPGFERINLIRGTTVGYDGTSAHRVMVDGSGSNLVGASITTPDNITYPMEVEWGTGCYFEVATRTASDLSRFTNGIYTIRLYDFTNGFRQTYSVPLMGQDVTQVPQVLSPTGLSMTNTKPTLTWGPITDFNANAGVLTIQNHQLGDDLTQIWTIFQPMTNYTVPQDLSAAWGYQLYFGGALTTSVNHAECISAHVSGRDGLFNTVTNGNPNLAFARGVTTVPRVFVGQDLGMGLVDYGFLPGSSCTFGVDFGDGSATNGTLATHRYDGAGEYALRFVVLDNTGVAATGLVTAAAYDLPRILGAWRTNVASFAMSFPTIDAAFYRVAYSDNLATTNWGGTVTNLFGDGATNIVQDAPGGGVPRRFYRVECDLNP